MRLLQRDLKHGKIAAQAQSLDDLWCLGQVIEKGDLATGRTTRKVKLGAAEEAVKKTYTLTLAVEKAEFEDQALRVSGTTTEPNEDIPKGAHHSISVETGDSLAIVKQKWQRYQLDRLEKATKAPVNVLVVMFDRETCLLARLKSQGYELVAELRGKVRKKGYDTAVTSNFYKEIIEAVKDYDSRRKPDSIIMASPAFWKEEMMNELKGEEIAARMVAATCSSVSESAIDEIMKRPEMASVLSNAEAAQHLKLVEEAMTAIAKDGKVAYGPEQVKEAVRAGAAEKLLITSRLVREDSGEQLIREAEENGAAAHIISSENAAGEKLDALGGMAAMLRYKIL